MLNKHDQKFVVKKRKNHIKNLEKFNLETGKLYKFGGKFRKVYQSSVSHITSYEEKLSNYRIEKGDYVIFFDAILRETRSIKKHFVKASEVDERKAFLVNEGCKIIKVEPFLPQYGFTARSETLHPPLSQKQNLSKKTSAKYYYIHVRETEKKYSGRLYIGHGEKFGWINIVQLKKEQILKQFQKVTIEKKD